MANEMILRIAMEQSSIDANCSPKDFTLSTDSGFVLWQNIFSRM